MKKIIIIFLSIFCFGITCHAEQEPKILYQYIKTNSQDNEHINKYEGKVTDIIEQTVDAKNVYYYNANATDNNVVLGNKCWRIIRTTENNGTKLLYNGDAIIDDTNGSISCNTTNNTISKGSFNYYYGSLIGFGYMFNMNYYNYTPVTQTIDKSTSYTFGKSVRYDSSTGLYTLQNTTIIDLWSSFLYAFNPSIINDYHYSCGNMETKCNEVRYYYKKIVKEYSENAKYNYDYIILKNGKNITDALEDALYSDDVNDSSSSFKNSIETWYKNNFQTYEEYLDKNAVYCNNRTFIMDKNESLNYFTSGMNPDGGRIEYDLHFRDSSKKTDLQCENVTDSFSVNNLLAPLSYPIGFITASEVKMINSTADATKSNYLASTTYWWTGSPANLGNNGTQSLDMVHLVAADGKSISYGYTGNSSGVRPVITLNTSNYIVAGSGTTTDPYTIQQGMYTIEKNDFVKIEKYNDIKVVEGLNINFEVEERDGYIFERVKVKDKNNNEISLTKKDAYNYSFTMPSSDVKIITEYKKVSSSIIEIIEKPTKKIKYNIEDINHVEYGTKIVFSVIYDESDLKHSISHVEVIDKKGNKIKCTKNVNDNKYEFLMPSSDATITPVYYEKSNHGEEIVKDFEITTDMTYITDVVRDKNNNIIVSGIKNKTYSLEKYDNNKNLLWIKDDLEYNYNKSMTVDDDGNIYTIAQRDVYFQDDMISIECPFQESYIYKTDPNGEVIFIKKLDETEFSNSATAIDYFNGKLFVLSNGSINSKPTTCKNGYCYVTFNEKTSIYSFDLDGNQIFKTTIDEEESVQEYERTFNFCSTIVGISRYNNFAFDEEALYGSILDYDYGYRYFKLDYDGNVIWVKKYEIQQDTPEEIDNFQDIALSPDKKKLFLGGVKNYTKTFNSEEERIAYYNKVYDYPNSFLSDNLDYFTMPAIIEVNHNVELHFETSIPSAIESIESQDEGLYVLASLFTPNVDGLNNEVKGVYLIRYDYDFNLKDMIQVNKKATFSNNDRDECIFTYEGRTFSRYCVVKKYSYEKEVTINLKDGDLKISEVFPSLEGKDIGWQVLDTSVATVTNNTITPLKEGKTTINALYGNDSYTIFLTIKDEVEEPDTPEESPKDNTKEEPKKEDKEKPTIIDIINPNTKDGIITIVIIMLIFIILIFMLHKKYNYLK